MNRGRRHAGLIAASLILVGAVTGTALGGGQTTSNVGTVLVTPSGNIACYTANAEFGPFWFACAVRETSAKRCAAGRQVFLRWVSERSRRARERPQVVCDRAFDPTTCCGRGTVLEYGHSLRIPSWNVRCNSRFAGLTCSSTSQHGFFVNRTAIRTW